MSCENEKKDKNIKEVAIKLTLDSEEFMEKLKSLEKEIDPILKKIAAINLISSL